MKEKISLFRAKAEHQMNRFYTNLICTKFKVKRILASNSGEGFFSSGIGILITVVVGGVLLTGIFLLFKDIVLPTVTDKIKDMFNYNG